MKIARNPRDEVIAAMLSEWGRVRWLRTATVYWVWEPRDMDTETVARLVHAQDYEYGEITLN